MHCVFSNYTQLTAFSDDLVLYICIDIIIWERSGHAAEMELANKLLRRAAATAAFQRQLRPLVTAAANIRDVAGAADVSRRPLSAPLLGWPLLQPQLLSANAFHGRVGLGFVAPQRWFHSSDATAAASSSSNGSGSDGDPPKQRRRGGFGTLRGQGERRKDDSAEATVTSAQPRDAQNLTFEKAKDGEPAGVTSPAIPSAESEESDTLINISVGDWVKQHISRMQKPPHTCFFNFDYFE
jgi:hypothetical protein